MQEPTSIKQIFQQMTPEFTNVVKGLVRSADPLQIQLINDDKMVLTRNVVCLPKHLSDYTVKVSSTQSTPPTPDPADPVPEEGEAPAPPTATDTEAEMTVHNALQTGEVVYLLSFNAGKAYYILDREAD